MDPTPAVAIPIIVPISISMELLMPLVFYMVAALYTVFTGILYYHWNTYANDKKVISLTYTIYLFLTLPLILIMGVTAFIF